MAFSVPQQYCPPLPLNSVADGTFCFALQECERDLFGAITWQRVGRLRHGRRQSAGAPRVEHDRVDVRLAAHRGSIAKIRRNTLTAAAICSRQPFSVIGSGRGVRARPMMARSVAPQVRKSLAVNSAPMMERR